MNLFYKNLSIWLIICLVGFLLFALFKQPPENVTQVRYNDFLKSLNEGHLGAVSIQNNTITWVTSDNNRFKTVLPPQNEVVNQLLKHNVKIEVREDDAPHWFMQTFLSWIPFILLIIFWFFFMQKSGGQGGGSRAMAFGKSRAKLVDTQHPTVTFEDVAGVDELNNHRLKTVG